MNPQRPPLPLPLLSALLLALAPGCSPSSVPVEDPIDPGAQDDGPGDPVDPGPQDGPEEDPDLVTVAGGPWVAELEVEQPAAESFVLRGTFPLPPGTWPETTPGELDPGRGAAVPFAVADYDGTPLASQVEVTSRYPHGPDGVDVVEVLARVRRFPLAATGSQVRYRVLASPHAARRVPEAHDVSALTEGPHELDPALVELLADETSIAVRARDVFGNTYLHHPLAAAHQRLRKYGRALAEVETYGAMLPQPPVSGPEGTLPHLFGVHAYLRTVAGEGLLELDLRVNNGSDHNDPLDTADDTLGTVYFESLELVVPAGWRLEIDFADPFFGAPHTEPGAGGERRVYPVVAPLEGGRMHVMPYQAQFHRRLALAREGSEERARARLAGEGVAFARRGTSGTDLDPGQPLFSWWHPGATRYFPQSLPIPDLSHVGGESLRALMAGRLAELVGHVTAGTGEGDYPLAANVLGWAHPWGVAYGGMTGGDEIVMVDGLETLSGASRAGYRYTQLVHRMHTSRQPSTLYQADGRPSSVEAWLIPTGPYGGYVPFNYYQKENGSTDPFELGSVPTFQVDSVRDQGLTPPYEAQLFAFEPHDFQHFIRYTRSAKVLTWLANDSLAADDLKMMAEAFHLSFHSFANNVGGGVQGSGLRSLLNDVEEDPGVGCRLGRGQGWGIDCALAAFRTAEPEWRARKRGWFGKIADATELCQSECTGFFQSIVNEHGLGGKYRVRQHIEHVIYENALRGMVESVFRRADPDTAGRVKQVLVLSHYASIGELAWSDEAGAPWSWTAVAPKQSPLEVWCHPGELPGDWHDPIQEKYQLFASLGDALYTTQDPVFLERAAKVLGTDDLFDELLDDGLKNLGNRATLLAVLQRLYGIL